MKKVVKIFLWVIGFLAIFFVAAVIIIDKKADAIAQEMINDFLSQHPLPHHEVTVESINVNLPARAVSLHQLEIKPDETVSSIKSDNLKNPGLLNAQIDEIEIRGVKIWKFFRKKIIDVGKITVEDPNFIFTVSDKTIEKKNKLSIRYIQQKKLTIDSTWMEKINMVIVDKFKINNGSLKILKHAESKPAFEVKEYSVFIKKAQFDTDKVDDLETAVSFKEARLLAKGGTIKTPDGLYTIYTGMLAVSYADASIIFDTLKIIPNHSKVEFGRAVGKQTDRFAIGIDKLEVLDINWDEMLTNDKHRIRYVAVHQPYLSVFRDKNMPFDSTNYPQLPQYAIKELKSYLKIDSVRVINGYLEYEELLKEADKPGKVVLSQLNATCYSITNDTAFINNNGSIVVKGDFNLYGKAPAQIEIKLPLNEKNTDFILTGSVKDADMRIFNPYTEHTVMVVIDSGNIKLLQFNAFAANDTASGTMRLLYDDLKITVLKSKEKEDILKKNKFLSFVGNAAVRDQNPPNGKPERIAVMFFERNRNKSLFNYMIKTLVSGFIATVGPTDKHIRNEAYGGSTQQKNERKQFQKKRKQEKSHTKREQKKEGRNKKRNEKRK